MATENHAYDLARLDHRTNNEHFDNDEDEEDERMQVEDENETGYSPLPNVLQIF